MLENLNVASFKNGVAIPEAKDDDAWESANDNKLAAWCYYYNDSKNGERYGKLYNWYAVVDENGLCPQGWHVPSDAEWGILVNYLGGEKIFGEKMKSNESGFIGLPGGVRLGNGIYSENGRYGYWWSSSEYTTYDAWSRSLNLYDGNSRRDTRDKSLGFSVRCLRD